MTTVPATSFGRYLKDLRLSRGEALTSYAARLGISYWVLYHMESGRFGLHFPTPDLLQRIAEVYGCTSRDLIQAAGYDLEACC